MIVIDFLRCPWMCYLGISQCTPYVMPQLKVAPHDVTLAEFGLVSSWRSTFEYKVGGIKCSVRFFLFGTLPIMAVWR